MDKLLSTLLKVVVYGGMFVIGIGTYFILPKKIWDLEFEQSCNYWDQNSKINKLERQVACLTEQCEDDDGGHLETCKYYKEPITNKYDLYND